MRGVEVSDGVVVRNYNVPLGQGRVGAAYMQICFSSPVETRAGPKSYRTVLLVETHLQEDDEDEIGEYNKQRLFKRDVSVLGE